MDQRSESEVTPMKNRTTVERTSDRELVVTRTFNGPARIVFEAWTNPALFQQWWVPKSAGLSLRSCEIDVRVGGGYRLVFDVQGTDVAFFGTYREVVPQRRLVWTNEEAHGAGQVSTVTFEERAGKTVVVIHELYPSKATLDEALANGSTGWTTDEDGNLETFDQLDALLLTLIANTRT